MYRGRERASSLIVIHRGEKEKKKMAVKKLIFLVLCLPLIISNATSFDNVKREDFWPVCNGEELQYETWQKGILPAIFQVIGATTLQGFIGQNYKFLNDNPNDKSFVYAISRCEGDLDQAVCGKCIARAASKLIQSCSGYKESRVWLDQCYLQADIIGTPRVPGKISDNTHISLEYSPTEFRGNMGERRAFVVALGHFLGFVSDKAAAEPSRFKRLDKENSMTKFQFMAQCNRDYSQETCKSCLYSARAKMSSCSLKTKCYFKGSGCVLKFSITNE